MKRLGDGDERGDWGHTRRMGELGEWGDYDEGAN